MEAIALADQVIVLDRGSTCQHGTVQEVFSKPADVNVARIVGVETVELARILEVKDGLATVAIGAVKLLAIAPHGNFQEAYACIRAEEVALYSAARPARAVSGTGCRPALPRYRPKGRWSAWALIAASRVTALVTRPAIDEMNLNVGDAVTASLEGSGDTFGAEIEER